TNHSGDVPAFTRTTEAKPTLLQEYVPQQTETNDLYWNYLERAEENLETRWLQLHVEPRADYFEARNTLLISPSLVSFLSAMLASVDPLLVPVLGLDIFRGLLSVVTSSRRSPAAGSNASASWQEARAGGMFPGGRENATRCLEGHYVNLTGDRQLWPRLSDQLFFESAVVEPLFTVYKSYLEKVVVPLNETKVFQSAN
ncbi:hypothetical protein V5799_029435, partial [Amblyomma americanum]